MRALYWWNRGFLRINIRKLVQKQNYGGHTKNFSDKTLVWQFPNKSSGFDAGLSQYNDWEIGIKARTQIGTFSVGVNETIGGSF